MTRSWLWCGVVLALGCGEDTGSSPWVLGDDKIPNEPAPVVMEEPPKEEPVVVPEPEVPVAPMEPPVAEPVTGRKYETYCSKRRDYRLDGVYEEEAFQAFDAQGRRTSYDFSMRSRSEGVRIDFSYEGEERVARRVDWVESTRGVAAPASWLERHTDDAGRIIQCTSSFLGARTWEYDERGRMIRYRREDDVLPFGEEISYEGREVVVRMLNDEEVYRTERYVFDEGDRPIRLTRDSEDIRTFAYDEEGRLVETTLFDGKFTLSNVYNAQSQLLSTSWADETGVFDVQRWTYESDGRVRTYERQHDGEVVNALPLPTRRRGNQVDVYSGRTWVERLVYDDFGNVLELYVPDHNGEFEYRVDYDYSCLQGLERVTLGLESSQAWPHTRGSMGPYARCDISIPHTEAWDGPSITSPHAWSRPNVEDGVLTP